MSDLSNFDHDQFHQLLEKGYTPEEAAQILLQARLSIVEACKKLLEEIRSRKATDKSQENR